MLHKIIRILLIVAFLMYPMFITSSKAVAQSNLTSPLIVKYEKVNPKDGFSYAIKRVKEKVGIFLLSRNPKKKLNYLKDLLGIRLSELKFVVDNKDIGNIQTASQRYFTTAGEITALVNSQSQLTSDKNGVITLFNQHLPVLESLRNTYNNTTAEWRFLRDDANYLIDYSTLLK
jgi:hypothetical protein